LVSSRFSHFADQAAPLESESKRVELALLDDGSIAEAWQGELGLLGTGTTDLKLDELATRR
jgi:hypothetical protein